MESLHEEWRPVVGREGKNEVSNLGRVRSLDRVVMRTIRNGTTFPQSAKGKILEPSNHSQGYRVVSIDGRRKAYVHALVAAAFIGPRPGGHDVNHIDGDKTNNAATNLEYTTRLGNMKHAKAIGLFDNSGEKNGRSIVTAEQIRHGYSLVKGGMRYRLAAAECGVSQDALEAACRGERWKHLGLEPIYRNRT